MIYVGYYIYTYIYIPCVGYYKCNKLAGLIDYFWVETTALTLQTWQRWYRRKLWNNSVLQIKLITFPVVDKTEHVEALARTVECYLNTL